MTVAALMTLATSARATLTFSLAGNWNSVSDLASNQWAYGTFSGGTNFVVPSSVTNSGTTENFWFFPPNAATDRSDPNIEKNLTQSAIFTSGAEFRPGTVSFGPFQGPTVAQFTAPNTGIFTISATFQTDQIRSSTSDGTTAFVYVGGVQKFSQTLTDPGKAQFGTAVTYSTSSIALTAGEKVDFEVANGAFTTQVDAILTEAPEPSVCVMMLGGLVIVAFAVRGKSALCC